MTFDEARDTYWKYYIPLEEQLLDTQRYVEFDYVNNGSAYSVEYLKLFQAVCSEIDVVGKVVAGILDPAFAPTKNAGINEWWYCVTNSRSITDWNFAKKDFSGVSIRQSKTLEARECDLLGKHVVRPWKDFKVVINPNSGGRRNIFLIQMPLPKRKHHHGGMITIA